MPSSTPISSVVFTRYAGALIDLAEKAKSVDKIRDDLLALGNMIDESPEFAEVVSSPLISKAKQASFMGVIADRARFNKLTKNFLGVLVQNRRLDALPGIINAYKKIIAKKSGQIEVSVETSVKLTASQSKEFKKKIEKALGSAVFVEEKITPEIMGGVIVTIGSYMIDDSVRRKLERLGAALKSSSNQNTVQNLKEVI